MLSVRDLLSCPNLPLVTEGDQEQRTTVNVLQETRISKFRQKVLHDPQRIRSLASKKRATSATTTLAGTNFNREILDEPAERLGNFHDSARALASCLQTRDVARKTDQSMVVAAKCMFHKLLGEASDDLERVTP